MSPAAQLQPRSRTIRYDNMKSAMAEETVIAMVLKAPALLDQTGQLNRESFSSPLLGQVYAQLQARHRDGLEVSLAGISDLSTEEMSHITGIFHRHQGPVSEQALRDCVQTFLAEHQSSKVETADDLLAFRNKMKERKGIKG